MVVSQTGVNGVGSTDLFLKHGLVVKEISFSYKWNMFPPLLIVIGYI